MAIEMIFAGKQTNRDQMIDVVCGDSNTKVVRLMIPVDVDGVDISGLSWRINIINSAKQSESQLPSAIEIADGNILIDWTIHGIATSIPGITQFQFEGFADGNAIWQTAKMYLRVKDRIEASDPSDEETKELTEVQKLIVYVESELQSIIDAGEDIKKIATNPPIIGENGNWWIGGEDTGVSVSGGIAFTTDETLILDPETNILSVNRANEVEADNTLPITSAAVFAEVGNINALLETI